MRVDLERTHLWIVGGGIAGMAAAAFAIRDAGVPGEHVHILEQLDVEGGSLDGARSPAVTDGWVTRGGRMLEEEAYRCTWDLFDSIPSLDDPDISVRQEIVDFNEKVRTNDKARLIDSRHRIIDASELGLGNRDRLEMMRLLGLPERALGARRIDEMFGAHFFTTNFWQMWRTTFAFQHWHSAAELRRYFLRFVQEFPRIHTLSGVRRTVYNQYDSMVVPLQRWMWTRGVDVRFATRVVDIDFAPAGQPRRAIRLHVDNAQGTSTIDLGEHDFLFATLGSITADTTYGGNDDVPPLIRDRADKSWSLWEQIAGKAPDFGRPNTFYGNIDENKWESFTLTMRGDTLLRRITEYTGNEPGTGALTTWFESGWHLSTVVPYQPHFPQQPRDVRTLWGYGFDIDNEGDYVRKKMSQATGKEILTELIHQYGFEDILDEVLATTDVTTVMMPYASALFSRRVPEDRPRVVPDGARNFAFLGQFTSLPEDVVFTVEYSVHGAMHAVYTLLGVDRPIPPIYHGLLDPKVGVGALEAAFR
ncbi:oleate hydratase [Rhodococcus sp. SGAir0479]|uniref:oleate hydratase n=1 Tax=Rhodococcus sp. SGAir0479 TaxID=2567884 RepID=UPI0010CD453D|nr:oleate hydratase [Rhodococcus sp. SGAir0479]QCQ90845.1 oleate hydratase [Rhodococcus sp. SGAir0479]